MILDSLERGICYTCRSVLRFLDRSVSRAMGCFFACFRVRDNNNRAHLRRHVLVSSLRPTEAVISKKRLSSLFVSNGKEESSLCSTGREDSSPGSTRIDKELWDEAMFLKACGTLPETPIEIRVAAEELKGQVPTNTDLEDLKFESWQTDLRQLSEALKGAPVSSDHSPISCISSVQTTEGISISSDEGTEAGCPRTAAKITTNQPESSIAFATPMALTTNTKRREKSVRFECNLDTSSYKGPAPGNDHQDFGNLESQLDFSVSKRSPRPTPLKLSDEMQTPGTVFPVTVDALAGGKNRIRSQYVYPAVNPIQDYSRWKAMKEDTTNSNQLLDEAGAKDPYLSNVDASVSLFTIPPPPNYETNHEDNSIIGDRPIIGMVAAQWHGAESSEVSHKWWDGNGIPNSTTKYKEDQKVSWHATPFEERLEKALCEESFVPQKKRISGSPIVFVDDCESSDSSHSHIQASTQPNSVVSV